MQVIYLKEQFGSALFYTEGKEQKQINFHPVGDDIGGIKLDNEVEADKPVIAALDQMIKDHVGGVYLATEAQYDAVKKKPIWKASNPASEPLKVFQPNRLRPVTDRQEDVAAADRQPSPRPGATISPVLAQDLTRPGAANIPPADNGELPPGGPKPVKPRVGRASLKAQVAPPQSETAPA